MAGTLYAPFVEELRNGLLDTNTTVGVADVQNITWDNFTYGVD